jgi:hypothetical protein
MAQRSRAILQPLSFATQMAPFEALKLQAFWGPRRLKSSLSIASTVARSRHCAAAS